jgi:hypothetical protein
MNFYCNLLVFFQRELLHISADISSRSMLEGSFDCIGLHRKGLYAGGQVCSLFSQF